MNHLTPLWQKVLVEHLNAKLGTNFTTDNVLFNHNSFYDPVEGYKIIDILPKGSPYSGRNVFYVKPYDPSKYFTNVPLFVYPEKDLTGKELMELVGNSWGVVFDFDNDFDSTFNNTIFRLDDMQNITVPFSDSSYIWEGSVDIQVGDATRFLPKIVPNRSLDALIYPDRTDSGTQSLKLLMAPVIITSKVLVRKFSGTNPVVIEDELLDILMFEIERQFISRDPTVLAELRSLLNGVTFTSKPNDDSVYDRFAGPDEPLLSEHFSGIPEFKFTFVEPELDIGILVGDIVLTDFPLLPMQNSMIQLAAGFYNGTSLMAVLEDQHDLYPERAEDINAILDQLGSTDATVFGSYTKPKGQGVVDGSVNPEIYFHAGPDSGYTGAVKVIFPKARFNIETENNEQMDMEDSSGNIELERRDIDIGKTSDGKLPISSDDILSDDYTLNMMIGFMAYEYDTAVDQNVITPSNKLVEVAEDNGYKYTHPDYPGVTIHTEL